MIKLVVRAELDEPAAVDHGDGVSAADGGEAVGDDDRRPPLGQAGEGDITAASVAASRLAVGSSRMRIGASLRIARAIANRWRLPPESVVPRSPITVSYPCGRRADEAVGVCRDGGPLDVAAGGFGPAVGDVLCHAEREQERLLEHDGDVAAEVGELRVLHVDAVDQHAPLPRIDQRGTSDTSVLLPAPVGPTTASILPASTSSDTS